MEKDRNLATVEERAYQFRIQKQITQRELAHLIGVSASYVSNWENGYNEITVTILNKLCNIYDASFDYMLGFTDRNNPKIKKIQNINKILLGARLREIRKGNRYTQEKFAKKINTIRTLISDYETGRKSISVADLKQICETFGYSADWCVGKTDTCIHYEPKNKITTREIKEMVNI